MFAKLSVLALFLIHVSAWVIDVAPPSGYPGDEVTLTFVSDGNDPTTVDLELHGIESQSTFPVQDGLSVAQGFSMQVTLPSVDPGAYQFFAIADGYNPSVSDPITVE